MSEPSPIAVPAELRALADHYPEFITALRDARIILEESSALTEREIELTRFGALIALGAPAGSYTSHVRRAMDGGMTEAEIWSIVTAIATIVGVPRVIDVVPHIAAAIEAARAG